MSVQRPARATFISASMITILITFLAMLAFAGNSLFCRLALADGSIDAASFTFIRLLSGAVALAVWTTWPRRSAAVGGSWWSAGALFVYAAGFSFAYLSLSTATGALLLFGAVQATMIGYGLWSGEKLSIRQSIGAMLAGAGVIVLMLPGLQAPSLSGSALMLLAGVAWGVYSLRGRGAGDPTVSTAGNFIRAVPMVAVLIALFFRQIDAEWSGIALAAASGVLASAAGYVLWYAVLPRLAAVTAAIVQLSVPVLATIGGVLFLDEPVTLRLAVASAAILGGLALFILNRQRAAVT